MKIFYISLCLLSITYIYSADRQKVSFLSDHPMVAEQELKIIDWALLKAVRKESGSLSAVQDRIEQGTYSYTEEHDCILDYDGQSTIREDISCPFHLKERVTVQENKNDYTTLMESYKTLTKLLRAEKDTNTEAKSVLIAIVPNYHVIAGLKTEYWIEEYPNPPLFVQVLIEKHKDANQNKINKNYLIRRLDELCEKKIKFIKRTASEDLNDICYTILYVFYSSLTAW